MLVHYALEVVQKQVVYAGLAETTLQVQQSTAVFALKAAEAAQPTVRVAHHYIAALLQETFAPLDAMTTAV
jgi:hypothetical protein